MRIRTIKKQGNEGKLVILEKTIHNMLKNENPLEGIYGMYGDHPHTPHIKKQRPSK